MNIHIIQLGYEYIYIYIYIAGVFFKQLIEIQLNHNIQVSIHQAILISSLGGFQSHEGTRNHPVVKG